MNLGKVKRSYKRAASQMLFQAGIFYLIFKMRQFSLPIVYSDLYRSSLFFVRLISF